MLLHTEPPQEVQFYPLQNGIENSSKTFRDAKIVESVQFIDGAYFRKTSKLALRKTQAQSTPQLSVFLRGSRPRPICSTTIGQQCNPHSLPVLPFCIGKRCESWISRVFPES